MPPGRSPLAAIVIALGAAILISWPVTSAESEVVARVGERTITRQEVDEQFSRQRLPPGTNPDSARVLFLESLVQKELLVLEARARGLFADSMVTLGSRQASDRLLQDRVKQDEVKVDSAITDADLQAHFKLSLSERKIAHIMHWSASSIDSARDRIDAGEPFDKVATAMSIDAQTAEAGGVLPWLNDTIFPAEFLAVLDTMQVGGIAGPFKSRFGWHMIREDSIRTRTGADLAAEREQVEKDLLVGRSREHRQQALDRYRQSYRFELDTTATVATVTEAGPAYLAVAADTSQVMVPMS
ncbi:MAG TPA: peptidylprolyl isomerase, partial [Candidatus Udaeobacter sp.]|nr:peptidylprolyl isomerase [Candidatus Udaeobacter sp.]